MTPTLFDPLQTPTADVDRACDGFRWLSVFARAGPTALVANVRTRMLGLKSGPRTLPVTVNEAEVGGSYVCLPHSAYALYARQELALVDVGIWRPVLAWLIDRAAPKLLEAGLNRIVHVDNWLLSTNLHGDWTGSDLPQIRRLLTARFPEHFLAIRSVDSWSCPQLLSAGVADGWRRLPSRQIWVVDDMESWARRSAVRHDRSVFARNRLARDGLSALGPNDPERIAELYRMLYVDKYSALNPVFTARFIRMAHQQGLLTFRGARDASGRLVAVSGSLSRGGILTPPVVGYDTDRPPSEGLYRAACLLFGDQAREQGLRLNGSAGAAEFKRLRGARPVVEYSLVYDRHLASGRRRTVDMLQWTLEQAVVPMMRRRGL